MGSPNCYWWEAVGDTAIADAVYQAARWVADQNQFRSQDNLRHARLYGGVDYAGFGPYQHRTHSVKPTTLSMNVVTACVDTLGAKITKTKPRPSFQTFGGNTSQQRRAKRLEKFIQGTFYEAEIYEAGEMVFRDSLILGTGVLKFFERNGKVVVERVLVDNILVDDADGINGKPRQMFERATAAKEVLKAEYARRDDGTVDEELSMVIDNSARPDDMDDPSYGIGDVVQVYEAWHLPSYEGAGDGLHVICTDKALLHSEKWTHDFFPFEEQRFSKRLVGWYGQGLVERLAGIQIEINRILRDITEALRLMSKPRYLAEVSSKIAKGHIRGGSPEAIGDVVTYTGTKPEVWSSNVVPPEQFAHLDRLYARAFEEAGISQLSANGTKPAGLNSAVAQREYNDTQTERFAVVAREWEQFYVRSAKLMIKMAKEIAEREGDYEVRAVSKNSIDIIKWSEVNLPEDCYVMQIFPASSLPTAPAARKDSVMDLIQIGLVTDLGEARRLLDMPDLEASNSVATAEIDDVDLTIEDIVERGEFRPPEPIQNLDMAIQRASAQYLRLRHSDIDQERLAMLLDWISQAKAMRDEVKAQQAQQMQMMQPQAQQAPQMPPAPQMAPAAP